MGSIIQKINFLKNENSIYLHFLKIWKRNFLQIYIWKIKFLKIGRNYFVFTCQFFLLISYSACFSMEQCFKRLIIHFLIKTFHIFYIKFHHRNIIFSLFSSTFSRICVLFISNGVWRADLALKLSKFFNFQD